MFVRQYQYAIEPGYEERAAALCVELAVLLRERGIATRVLVGDAGDPALHIEEEHANLAALRMAPAALERDPAYRTAIAAWAEHFYPLVRSALPARVLHDATPPATTKEQRAA